MSIHLKSSIFKELRVAKVSVVLEGVEGAAVGDATYIHVRALRVITVIISTAQAVLSLSVGSGIPSIHPVPHFGLSVPNCSKRP